MGLRRNRFFLCGIFCFLLVSLSAQEPGFSGREAAALEKTLRDRRVAFDGIRFFLPEDAPDSGALSLLASPEPDSASGNDGKTAGFDRPLLLLAVPQEAARNREPSFGIETALALIDLLKASGSPAPDGGPLLNVKPKIAFLSAPETACIRQGEAPAEAAGFPENTLLLFLDLCEAPRTVDFYYGSQKARTPLFMLRPFAALCRAEAIPFRLIKEGKPAGERNTAFAVLDFARSMEADALYIGGEPSPPGANGAEPQNPGALSPDTLARLLLRSFAAIEDTGYNADRNYSALTLPAGRILFISEAAKMVLAIIIAGLFLATVLVFAVGRQLTGGGKG